MALSIRTREVATVAVLDVEGELVGKAGSALVDQVRRLVDAHRSRILLNLEKVPDADDSGVAHLISILTLVHRSAVLLKVLKPSKSVRERITKCSIVGYPTLESFFEVFDDEKDAVASFSRV